MFFAAPTQREEALLLVPELAELADTPETELTAALMERFATQPASHWADAFSGSSTAIMPLGSLHNTRDAALQLESAGELDLSRSTFSTIRHDLHPMGRWCDLVAPNAVRPSQSKITIPGPMPRYGADTPRILSDLGLSKGQVETMIQNGTAGESWYEHYLPE